MDNIKYFIGKICTIFTVPTNRNLREELPDAFPSSVYNYFVGKIENIDSKGMLVSQLKGDLKSYFFLDHIVSISEEKVEHTNVDDLVNEVQLPPETESDFVDPDYLSQLSGQLNLLAGMTS